MDLLASANRLRKEAKIIEGLKFTPGREDFALSDALSVIEKIGVDEGQRVIYRIKSKKVAAHLPKKLARGQTRKCDGTACNLKLSRINDKVTTGTVLYVGSSESFKQRLRQHLACEAHSVYAMHLKCCLPLKVYEAAEIVLEWWLFEDPPAAQIVQILEDHLWDDGKPRLGRRGAK